jgi:hypothetical protein
LLNVEEDRLFGTFLEMRVKNRFPVDAAVVGRIFKMIIDESPEI